MRTLAENIKRSPAVAGLFYPGDAGALGEAVRQGLQKGSGPTPPTPPRAIISPHAGYVYSGWLAGAAWGTTRGGSVKHAVVLSPSHRLSFRGIALPSGAAFAMPGFDLPINAVGRDALLEGGLANIVDAAHAQEHGAETQFPFLHALHPEADVLPLVLGQTDDRTVAAAIDLLNSTLDHPLFVLSSDLSHFLTEDAARRKDDETTRLIETGAREALTPEHACGARAIRGYLASHTGRGARITRLARATSADVTHDSARVVGYGAWALHGPDGDSIAETDRHALLKVARAALTIRTRKGRDPKLDLASFSPRLHTFGAAFVTLTKAGRLRGCIGSLKAHRALVEDVAHNAVQAGHGDPRFAPVTADELDDLRLKIAVLAPPAPMSFTSEDDLIRQLRPGDDGLILSDRGQRGTFLPMVWDDLPDPVQFWQHLKRKAGLPPDYWSETLTVERYRAESFAES